MSEHGLCTSRPCAPTARYNAEMVKNPSCAGLFILSMSALTEFIQDGIRYVPCKIVAKSVDLSSEYLTRFCRERLIMAVFHKGAWYAHEGSRHTFLQKQKREQEEYNRKLSQEKKREVQELRAAQAAPPPAGPCAAAALAQVAYSQQLC
jgi:hypothetical protein